LRDAGDSIAGGQQRRRGGRIEGDDGGEGADDDQQEQAGADEDASKHGVNIRPRTSAIHCPFANSPRISRSAVLPDRALQARPCLLDRAHPARS
jgi:hypothetical protein